jgi:HK97 gp10 family phage protein
LAAEFEFTFSSEFLKLGIKKMDVKLNRAAFGVCKYWDSRIEAHMKHKAPWKDRTTNARNGLFAVATKFSGRVFGIILAHSVTYGIYLERGTRYMRARPIIIPTLETYAPKVIKTFHKILNKL